MRVERYRLGCRVCFWTCASVIPMILQAQNAGHVVTDFSKGIPIAPNFLRPYEPQPVAPVVMENSARLRDLIRDRKLELSLADALALAIENNLDITVERFIVPSAQTDVLRTKAGQAARGFSGALIPPGLNVAAIGAGVTTAVAGGGVGSAGGITGGGGAVNVAPVGTFDPTVNFNYSWDRTSSPLNTLVVAGTPLVTTASTAYSGSLTQFIPEGTSYFFGLAAIRASSTQQNLLFNPEVVTRMSMGFNQPLLSGFGFLPNERFLIVARNNLKVSGEIFRQQVIQTIVQVENAYWNMAAFQLSVNVAEQSLAAARNLYDLDRRRAEIGVLARLDVVSDESEVAGRERDLVVARTNLQFQQTQLKDMLTKETDPNLEAAEVVTTDSLPEPRDSDIPEMETALATAFNNRPDLRVANVNLQNENVSARFTANNLLPVANVFSQYAASGLSGVSGLGTPEITRNGAAQSLTQLIEGAYPEYSYGLSLTVPIRNRAAQADNLRAQLETQQSEIALQSLRKQIALDVRQALIGLIQGKSQVQAAHEASRLAAQNVETEQKKLEAGASISYNVILRQRDLVTAEQAEVQAVANYANALVAMDRALGDTLEHNGIKFEDALTGTITSMPTPPTFNIRGFSVPGK